MKKTYIPRLFDEILRLALESKGAVLVAGAKWQSQNLPKLLGF